MGDPVPSVHSGHRPAGVSAVLGSTEAQEGALGLFLGKREDVFPRNPST